MPADPVPGTELESSCWHFWDERDDSHKLAVASLNFLHNLSTSFPESFL